MRRGGGGAISFHQGIEEREEQPPKTTTTKARQVLCSFISFFFPFCSRPHQMFGGPTPHLVGWARREMPGRPSPIFASVPESCCLAVPEQEAAAAAVGKPAPPPAPALGSPPPTSL